MSTVVPDQEFCIVLATAVSKALKELLSEKHLYQSVEVDDSFIKAIAGDKVSRSKTPVIFGNRSFDDHDQRRWEAQGRYAFDMSWLPPGDGIKPAGFSQAPLGIGFELPTILTFCHECKHRWPFNPQRMPTLLQVGKRSRSDQWFFLVYECQACKTDSIRFLVRRNGKKLILSGRDPIEIIPTPKELPKANSKYYSDALIAHHAGQTLAGIFLLRVFIEQYWRSQPTVQTILESKPRASGDEMGSAYQSGFPQAFKEQFPTLKETYSSLSDAIHSANPDVAIFDKATQDITEHFQAKRLHKIN